jgi:hypothetical protein
MLASAVFDGPDNLLFRCPKKIARIVVSSVVLLIAALGASQALAADSVEFTSVPPYGSPSNLSGKVYGVNPTSYAVAVFIYIDEYGWFTKPTCAGALTPLQSDGSWTADITTGGVDTDATRIAVFVVPASYNQPCVTNVFCLPAALLQQSVANAIVTRTAPTVRAFHWSGFDWTVKTSTSPVGPGPNLFSDSTNNVFIDSQGQLHLRITNVSNAWQCAEILSQTSPGYGTYRFHLASPVDTLDPNIILGLFTWSNAPDSANHEMDVECGRWVDPADYANSQFVRQPYYLPQHIVRYRIPTLATNATPSFNWETNAINYACVTGTAGVAALETNSLLNPSFESGTGAAVSNWVAFGDVYRTESNTTSTTTALDGAWSLKMFGPFNPTLSESGAYQNLSASAGQTWGFSGFGLNWSGDTMTNTTAYGMAQLIFLDATNNVLQTSQSQHYDSNTPLDLWQYFQITATAPAGTAAVQTRVSHFGEGGIAGSVWWDLLSLTLNPNPSTIAQWTFTNVADIPPTCDENVHFNFYLANGNPPMNGQPAEMVISQFEFIPNDTDGDGMPDSWEVAHGLNPNDPSDANRDDDGSGFTNLQEYLAGTDPANPASCFHITSAVVTGNDMQVTFTSVLDKNYILESATSLPSPIWSTVTQNVAGTGSPISIADLGGATNASARYYRVRLMQ